MPEAVVLERMAFETFSSQDVPSLLIRCVVNFGPARLVIAGVPRQEVRLTRYLASEAELEALQEDCRQKGRAVEEVQRYVRAE